VVGSSFLSSPEAYEGRFTLGNGSVTYVESGILYFDSLPPGGSKRYMIEAPEQSLVSFFIEPDPEEAVLNVEAVGQVNRTRLAVVWLPEPYIYYASVRAEVQFKVANSLENITSYRFYIDISQPLKENNSKTIPLKGGKATFHVDLRKDDRVVLRVGATDNPKLRIWVFVLYYDLLPEMTYRLRLHGKSLYGALYFSADIGRRYYILVDSTEGKGDFFLVSSTYSPPWNQEWFWLVILFSFLIVAISLADIRRSRELEKGSLFALISYYCWIGTIGLALSAVGSLGYGTTIYELLFYLMIFSYIVSHVLWIYAAHLVRKVRFMVCPSCGAKVNVEEVNYCCGGIVRNVSEAWFLLPLSLGFLFFIVSYIAFERISPMFTSSSLWAASCGSLIGGIMAWWINRRVYTIKLWKQNPERYYVPTHIPFVPIYLLITGILFSFLSPLLIGILLESLLTQNVESFLPAHAPWVRIRIAPLTLPLYAVLGFAVSAMISGGLIAYRIRKILTRGTLDE